VWWYMKYDNGVCSTGIGIMTYYAHPNFMLTQTVSLDDFHFTWSWYLLAFTVVGCLTVQASVYGTSWLQTGTSINSPDSRIRCIVRGWMMRPGRSIHFSHINSNKLSPLPPLYDFCCYLYHIITKSITMLWILYHSAFETLQLFK